MTTIDKFKSLEWHDAALVDMVIDRRKPGENDIINIMIKWPSGAENTLSFHDCYSLDARMNFGVIADECILSADCYIDGEGVTDIKRKWSAVGVELDDLHCFDFETNSTSSRIKIYALSFTLV